MSSSQPLVTKLPNISGGIPTSDDLAPSIVFIVLYAPSLAFVVCRAFQYRTPLGLIIDSARLALFTCIRLVTFIIRAVEAEQAKNGAITPDTNLFVGEQILLGIGYIVLVSQLVRLMSAHLVRTDIPPHTHNMDTLEAGIYTRSRLISRLMSASLIIAFILGIIAGTKYSQAIRSASVASQTKTERIVSATISLINTTICLFTCLLLVTRSARHPLRSSAYLLVTACILVIVPSYRIASLADSTDDLSVLISTRIKVEFWILQITMEWIVLVLLIAVDVRVWFDAGGEEAKQAMQIKKGGRAEETVELGEVSKGDHARPVATPVA